MYVYFIKSGNKAKAPIKIGISDLPEKRILSLQVGNPDLLTLICKIKIKDRRNAEYIENIIHRKFRKQHIRGEWFKGHKINIKEALLLIDPSVNLGEVKVTGIHGTKKDAAIKNIQNQNKNLKERLKSMEAAIDDDLDRAMIFGN